MAGEKHDTAGQPDIHPHHIRCKICLQLIHGLGGLFGPPPSDGKGLRKLSLSLVSMSVGQCVSKSVGQLSVFLKNGS